MNMFAGCDETPTMTFQDIRETKRHGQRGNSIPPQTQFAIIEQA